MIGERIERQENMKKNKMYMFVRKYYIKLFWKKEKLVNTISPLYATKKAYFRVFERKLDLSNPCTINEKLQYLKFNDYYNNELVSTCADKYRVREYLRSKGLEKLLPNLYGVYYNVKDIDWNKLPNQFVIKCNHGCGYNIICSDKKTLDIVDAKKKLKKWMRENYWKKFGEVHYRLIHKAIIAEEFLGYDILTYKFYCFNGKPKILYVSSNGENGEKDKYVTYYHTDFTIAPYKLHCHETNENGICKPKNYDMMLQYAEILSEDFPFVRVDLYDIEGKIYLSELTFFPTGGFMELEPAGTDYEWGQWLEL